MVRNMAFVNSIRTYSEKKLIGYTREQLFDVVAAVENYYLFVPACRRSDVVQRGPDRIKAKLEIGIPPLLEAYTSNVKLDKPRLITASCIEGNLFKHLETRWRFRLPPQPYSSTEVCLLDFYVSFEFKSLLYAKLASALFDEMVRLNSNKNIEMETICNPIQVDNDGHNNDVVADHTLTATTGIKNASGANEMETLSNHHMDRKSLTTTATLTTTSKNLATKQQPHHQRQNEEQKVVVANTQPIDSANIKIKRCKHGRIIIKDSSKKKPMHQGDSKEIKPIQSRKQTEQVVQTEEKVEEDVSSIPNQQAVEKVVGCDQSPSTATAATMICSDKTTNRIVDSPMGSDRVYGPKERDSNEVNYSSKFTPHSGDNNNNNSNSSNTLSLSRRTRSRSRSPLNRDRRRVSQSPTHRKSPRRYRDRSPKRRQRSKSPRRCESSREKGSRNNSQELGSNRGSSTRRNRSSVRQDHGSSPSSSHRRDRRSPVNKNRSSRRRYSESSSDDDRASPTNFGRRRRNSIRSPETRPDRYSRTSGVDISRDSIFGKSPARTLDNLDKDLSSSNVSKETFTTKQLPPTSGIKVPLAQQSLPTTSSQATNCPATKTAQPQPSPEKSPLSETSLTPTTDGSISSDIYDPEGPIISISPGDSPPLSPLIKAAKHNNNSNNNLNHHLSGKNSLLPPDTNNEKGNTEDDVPSSAVELNKKEKYLQKLNRQERVVEEIKIALKPHYQKRAISKEQYKDVLRRAVPKICHSKDGEINPIKIRIMVEAYVKKMKKKNQSK